MKYFYIEPEVAGGLGKNTVMNTDVHPPVVSKLHYHFDGWLGDELLESFPCFIASERMKQKLQEAQFTGTSFDQVEITASEQFEELYPSRKLPRFFWLRVQGTTGQDDFGTAPDGRLIVSERALGLLQELGISHALVTEFSV
jgi:hypothetical protein